MEPSWQPDPSGRHHYRWWDGLQWSDQVADGGVVGTDPIPGTPPPGAVGAPVMPETTALPDPAVMPGTPIPGAPPAPGPSPSPGAALPGALPGPWQPSGPQAVPGGAQPGTGGGKGKVLLLVAAGVVAAVVVVVLAVLFVGRGGGGKQTGVFRFTLTSDDSVHTQKIHLRVGEGVRIRVEPSRRLDAELVLLVDEKTAREEADVIASDLTDQFSDSDPDSVFDSFYTDAESLFPDGKAADKFTGMFASGRWNSGTKGEYIASGFVSFVDADYTIAIGSTDQASRGDVRLVVEKYDGRYELGNDLSKFFDKSFFTDDAFFSDDAPFTPDR